MDYKKSIGTNKILCKNNFCPCNNAVGDDGTASLEYYYCLNDFCEYPFARR